jgi:hypothetical protein
LYQRSKPVSTYGTFCNSGLSIWGSIPSLLHS